MSFPGPHHRRQQVDFLSGIILENEIQDLLFGVFHHRLARKIRIRHAGTGKKQTEIVVYLGRGAHRGAGILVRSLLFDRNHRAQSRNLVHIRTFQIAQKIAGISRKGFDIAALSFSKKGVESQGRFSAAAQSGNNGETVAGNLGINVFQVVHARTIHINIFFFLHIHRIHIGCKFNVSARNIRLKRYNNTPKKKQYHFLN